MSKVFSTFGSTLSVLMVIFLFSSCSPRVNTSFTKKYPAADPEAAVTVYDLTDNIPANAEMLGYINIDDTGFSTNCDYLTVLNIAKTQARQVGGNALKIKTHRYPDASSSCHRIYAQVYKLSAVSTSQVVTPPTEIELAGDISVVPDKPAVRDTIQYSPSGLGYKYTYKNEPMTIQQLESMLSTNSTAHQYLLKAKSTSPLISVLSYAGGGFIGYPIGTMLGGGEPQWTMALIGCGLIAIALPITAAAENNLKKAVRYYNNGIAPAPKTTSMELKMGATQNGIGVVLRF